MVAGKSRGIGNKEAEYSYDFGEKCVDNHPRFNGFGEVIWLLDTAGYTSLVSHS